MKILIKDQHHLICMLPIKAIYVFINLTLLTKMTYKDSVKSNNKNISTKTAGLTH